MPPLSQDAIYHANLCNFPDQRACLLKTSLALRSHSGLPNARGVRNSLLCQRQSKPIR